MRNDYVGHGPQRAEAVYEPEIPPLLAALAELALGLAKTWRYRLLVPVEFDWGAFDTVNYVARELRGPYAVFPTVATNSSRRLAKKHVFLARPGPLGKRQGIWLDLDPLVTYAVCPLCQKDDVFYFDCRKDDSMQLRAALNGHTIAMPI